MKSLRWVKYAFALLLTTNAMAQLPPETVVLNAMNSLRMVIETRGMPLSTRMKAAEALSEMIDELSQKQLERLLPGVETPFADLLWPAARLCRAVVLNDQMPDERRVAAAGKLAGMAFRCPTLAWEMPEGSAIEPGVVRNEVERLRKNFGSGLRWRSENGLLRR